MANATILVYSHALFMVIRYLSIALTQFINFKREYQMKNELSDHKKLSPRSQKIIEDLKLRRLNKNEQKKS